MVLWKHWTLAASNQVRGISNLTAEVIVGRPLLEGPLEGAFGGLGGPRGCDEEHLLGVLEWLSGCQ